MDKPECSCCAKPDQKAPSSIDWTQLAAALGRAQKNLAGTAKLRAKSPEPLIRVHPSPGGIDGFSISVAAVAKNKVFLSGAGIHSRTPFDFMLTLDFAQFLERESNNARMVLHLVANGPRRIEITAPFIPVGAIHDPQSGQMLRFADFEVVRGDVVFAGGPSWRCLWCLLPIAGCALGCLPLFFPPWIQYLACVAACAADPIVYGTILACLMECGMFDA